MKYAEVVAQKVSRLGGYYTNLSETPLNVGKHFIRENGLSKPFC